MPKNSISVYYCPTSVPQGLFLFSVFMANGRVVGLYQQLGQRLANRQELSREYRQRCRAFNTAQALNTAAKLTGR
jgi:hypothetical protein